MPSLYTYNQLMKTKGETSYQQKINQSNMIMEATWNEDSQSRNCYIYDYYHDDEKDKNNHLSPQISKTKTLISAKFITSTYNTMDKDAVEYKLQFKPSQINPLDYYNDYIKRYSCEFPISLYVDIPDKGVYNRWLVVAQGNRYDTFETWLILPCDHLYQWVYTKNGIRYKYEMWGASRSQNS